MMTGKQIAQTAHKYMQHDMIARHTELPDFPSGRVSLLHAVLGHQPLTAPLRELLALATSLVQMGLDTHDTVDNGTGHDLRGMRKQQLKVLAGDFFSARFYQLLSQAGQIDTIRRLSEAVCDINRTKMSLYAKMKQMKLSAEEYLAGGAELRSRLLLSFTGFMHGLYERLWPEVVDRFSRCELLLLELARISQPASLQGSWGVWHILHEGNDEDRQSLRERHQDTGFVRALLEKYEVEAKLGMQLRQSVAQLQALIQRLQSDKLHRELQPLVEPFLEYAETGRAAALKELG